jgi:hypothetical protein
MAVEFMMRNVPGIGTKYTVEEMGAALPDNFRREDRRRLIGLHTTDAQGFVDGMRAYFELGHGTPAFSVPRSLPSAANDCALSLQERSIRQAQRSRSSASSRSLATVGASRSTSTTT